jgi:hypothetical protein
MNILASIAPMAREVRPITDFSSAASTAVAAKVIDAARAQGEALIALIDPEVGSQLDVRG